MFTCIVVPIGSGELLILVTLHRICLGIPKEQSQAEQSVFIIFSGDFEVIVMSVESAAIKSLHMYIQFVRLIVGKTINLFQAEEEVAGEAPKTAFMCLPVSTKILSSIYALLDDGPTWTSNFTIAQYSKGSEVKYFDSVDAIRRIERNATSSIVLFIIIF